MPKSPAGEVRVFSCGDRIEAKCPGWIKCYQGKIVAVDKGRGVYDILFDDGDRQTDVPAANILTLEDYARHIRLVTKNEGGWCCSFTRSCY